jgi:hypothetical protein
LGLPAKNSWTGKIVNFYTQENVLNFAEMGVTLNEAVVLARVHSFTPYFVKVLN